MTPEQIREWAIEAGFELDTCSPEFHARIARFAAFAVAHEREQCALVCERLGMATNGMYERNHECAEAIRARGTE